MWWKKCKKSNIYNLEGKHLTSTGKNILENAFEVCFWALLEEGGNNKFCIPVLEMPDTSILTHNPLLCSQTNSKELFNKAPLLVHFLESSYYRDAPFLQIDFDKSVLRVSKKCMRVFSCLAPRWLPAWKMCLKSVSSGPNPKRCQTRPFALSLAHSLKVH